MSSNPPINFRWYFFEEPLKEFNYNLILNGALIILPPLVERMNLNLQKISDESTFCLEKESHIYEDTEYCKISLSIEKVIGDFSYSNPWIVVLLGKDTLLCYWEQIRMEEFFTNLKAIESIINLDFFKQFIDTFNSFMENEIAKSSIQKPLIIEGRHHCYLNCGMCCDGQDKTRSPMLGGQYCKALTDIGKFCLCYLRGLPPDHNVCVDYTCGLLQEPEWDSQIVYGCKIKHFLPRYDDHLRIEFINFMRKYYKILLNYSYGPKYDEFLPQPLQNTLKINPELESLLEPLPRSLEINAYWDAISYFQTHLKKLKEISPQFYREFYKELKFRMARNQIKKVGVLIEEFLADSNNNLPNILDSELPLHQIRDHLKHLYTLYSRWFSLYSARTGC